MSKQGTEAQVARIPDCDRCKYGLDRPGVPAIYDMRFPTGRWGFACQACFDIEGGRLGTGHGQRLVLS